MGEFFKVDVLNKKYRNNRSDKSLTIDPQPKKATIKYQGCFLRKINKALF